MLFIQKKVYQDLNDFKIFRIDLPDFQGFNRIKIIKPFHLQYNRQIEAIKIELVGFLINNQNLQYNQPYEGFKKIYIKLIIK